MTARIIRRISVIVALGLSVTLATACHPISTAPGPVCTIIVVGGQARDFCR